MPKRHFALAPWKQRWFVQRVADGEVLSLGSAPGEVWRREEVLALSDPDRMKDLNAEAGLGDQMAADPPREVEAYEMGDTGWIMTHSSFVLEDGSMIPIRASTVLSRSDGAWTSVLTATHVLVPNDLIAPGSPLVSAAMR